MPSLRLTLSYDGTGFVGWQRQAEGTSIQGLLEGALERIEGSPVAVVGAGRTDAGVHALGQVASAIVTRSIEIDDLHRALNGLLPPAIRVIGVQTAADGFNARFAARSKTYRYRISLGEICSPFDRQYAWHLRGPLDVDALAAAAPQLEGRHDFSAFRASGGGVATSVRTIERSTLTEHDPLTGVGGCAIGRLIVYEVTADGFLRHMVRNIVGTLVEIGRRRLAAATISEVTKSRDRNRAGPTAPAHGLFLDSVRYDGSGSGSVDDEG